IVDCKAPVGVLRTCLEHFLPTFDDLSLGARIEFGHGKGVPRKSIGKVQIRFQSSSDCFLPCDEHRWRDEPEQQSVGINSSVDFVASYDIWGQMLHCVISSRFGDLAGDANARLFWLSSFLKKMRLLRELLCRFSCPC